MAPWPGSTGRPIAAVVGGTVVRVQRDNPWFGNYVVTRVSYPREIAATDLRGAVRTVPAHQPFYLLYAHMHDVAVSRGDQVRAGQQLGTIGNTGFSFGPHLHLEMRLGYYADRDVVNPLEFLAGSIAGLRDEIRYA